MQSGARSVGNGLQVVGDAAVAVQDQVAILHRDSGMLPLCEIRNRVLERASEIGTCYRAAVAHPPRRVDGELLQVGQPPCLRDSADFARWQSGEFAQVDGLGAFDAR